MTGFDDITKPLGTYKSIAFSDGIPLSFVIIMKFTTVFVVLATLGAAAVSGLPLPATNAERIARGLTPKPPVNLARRDALGGSPVLGMLMFYRESSSFLIRRQQAAKRGKPSP